MSVGFRVFFAIIYFLAGFAIYFGRRRIVENARPSIMVIPAGLLVIAAITTLIR